MEKFSGFEIFPLNSLEDLSNILKKGPAIRREDVRNIPEKVSLRFISL